MMRVLVSGGAGYIGAHVVRALRAAGHGAWVLDDLSTGRAALLPDAVPLIPGSVTDPAVWSTAFAATRPDAVIHLAGRISVPDSLRDPEGTFAVNLGGTQALLAAARGWPGLRGIVFSSSAAIYGAPAGQPIGEATAPQPLSPYGASKLAAERALFEAAAAGGPPVRALRYFNAVGTRVAGEADPIGPVNRTHLHIFTAVAETILARRPSLTLHGTRHPTPDGTALRDYTHVSDLAAAHVAALADILAGGGCGAINLGSGRALSVAEIVAAGERVAGRTLPVDHAPPRPGDVPALLAATDLARQRLGWAPRPVDPTGWIAEHVVWERRRPGWVG